MNLIQDLENKKLITPPSWLSSNVHYLTLMGSVAYGVSSDTSDCDIYGFCIPRKEVIFPHIAGIVQGFGNQGEKFEQYQQHHVVDPSQSSVIRYRKCPKCGEEVESAIDVKPDTPADWFCKNCNCGFWNDQITIERGKEYDLTVYNIVKYFQLLMECNPNLLDSIYTPVNCVLHMTKVGQMVRDKRKIFLHKGVFHTCKGYAYSQLNRMTKSDKTKGKRRKLIEKFGFDVKFSYHIVRLLGEAEQILVEGDLDIQRNREELKSIRRGEWSEQRIRDYFTRKEAELAVVYQNSKLPHSPDEGPIKELLLNCLEEHYGSLSACVERPDKYLDTLKQVKALVEKAGV